MVAPAAVIAIVGAGFALAQPWEAGKSPANATPSPLPTPACASRAPSPAPKPTTLPVPERRLAKRVDYWAVVYTACGDFKIDLQEQVAPDAVGNFVSLAKKGFYDGLAWVRVAGDFLIHSGDPNNDLDSLPDGPGYTVSDAVTRKRSRYTFGAVGFINMGDSGYFGSQFFVVAHDLRGALAGNPKPAVEGRGQQVLFGRVPRRFYGSIFEISRHETGEISPGSLAFIERVEIVERRRR